MRTVTTMLAVVLVTGAAVLAAIPTEEVPLDSIKGGHWTIDLNFRTPQRIVMTNADGSTSAYWYLLYVVTNNTGEAREFVPQATIFTDNGIVIRDAIYPDVVAAVKEKYRLTTLKNSIDMMTPGAGNGDKADKASGPSLKAGEEEAQQGIFVFPETDPNMHSFKIFITGLSGEFIVRQIPAASPEGKPTDVVLRKTLELNFKSPGLDASPERLNPVYLTGQKYIWR